ncbi:hypothetical protein GGI42DRAFT_24260 [Trichoderma sp. SZMC 28013]
MAVMSSLERLEITTSSSIINGTLNFSQLEAKPVKRSLGMVAEDCFGPVEINTAPTKSEVMNFVFPAGIILTGDINKAIIQAFTNWYRLQYIVAVGVADRVLSWNQRYSYQLLYDWWIAAFQDPSTPLKKLDEFIGLSETLKSEMNNTATIDASRRDLWACINRHKQALGLGGATAAKSKDFSPYNTSLCRLFITEFLCPAVYIMDQTAHIQSLDFARHAAATDAYCFQMAAHCFGPLLPELSPHTLSEFGGHCPWICSTEASDPSYSRTLGRGPLIRACSWLDPTTCTSPQYPYPKNTTMEDLDGWPEFLWDIENRCIVFTRYLEEKHPAYIAISHTWGRWQKENDQVVIEGGLGLPIPQNEKFNVKELPDALARLKSKDQNISVDYVWLDLLCIPQVPKEKDWDTLQSADIEFWLKVQKREIARQGPIFRNAQKAIAWLHDVNDFSCLTAFCEFLSLSYFLEDSDESIKKQYESTKDAILDCIFDRHTGLVVNTTEAEISARKYEFQQSSSEVKSYEPTGWFTSLWTLQEICLRPDMWLATASWDILTIGQNTPVAFNGLLSLLTHRKKDMQDEERLKSTMEEIHFWANMTGLDDLLQFSMIDILRLGDRRYCRERRAEAIMSAIGVIDWFDKSQESEEHLILGRYPQNFISEVRNHIPGKFFATFAKRPHTDPHDRIRMNAIPIQLNGHDIMSLYPGLVKMKGSLLPFSEIGHSYYRIPRDINNSPVEMDTHQSVHSWEINTSGTVNIYQACVLSSSVLDNIKKSPAALPCFFWGFFYRTTGLQKSWMRRVEMHEWTAARKSEIHMVVVMRGTCEQARLAKDPISATTFAFTAGKSSTRGHVVQGIVLRCVKKDSKRTAEKKGRTQGADGKPQRLVKIGNFYASCPGKILLPEPQSVSWEVI